MADAAPEPGARHKGEPAKGYAIFTRYRDLPPHERSLVKAGKAYFGEDNFTASRLRQMGTWSSKWSWVERAAQWDDHLDEIGRLEQIEAIKQMRRRHAQVGVAMLNRVAARLMGGQVAVAGGQLQEVVALDTNKLGVAGLARLADVGVKIERMARGEPEVIEEHRHKATGSDDQEMVKQWLANPQLAALADQLAQGMDMPANG